MRAFKLFLANILFVQFTLAQYSVAAGGKGPGSTGGGEHVSQEARNIMMTLPDALRAKGIQYFPEIDLQKMEDVLEGRILIEIKENITVNGAPKEALFDQSRNLVQISALAWKQLSPIRKTALMLHEVLGLMGLEKNDDYPISNRMLGIEFLSGAGLKASRNQIFPQDNKDPQVIFWRIFKNGSAGFYYCSDRNVVTTCQQLGSRTYTKMELVAKYKSYMALADDHAVKHQRDTKRMKLAIPTGLGLIILVMAVAATAPVTIPSFFILAGGLSALGGMVLVATGINANNNGVRIDPNYSSTLTSAWALERLIKLQSQSLNGSFHLFKNDIDRVLKGIPDPAPEMKEDGWKLN